MIHTWDDYYFAVFNRNVRNINNFLLFHFLSTSYQKTSSNMSNYFLYKHVWKSSSVKPCDIRIPRASVRDHVKVNNLQHNKRTTELLVLQRVNRKIPIVDRRLEKRPWVCVLGRQKNIELVLMMMDLPVVENIHLCTYFIITTFFYIKNWACALL